MTFKTRFKRIWENVAILFCWICFFSTLMHVSRLFHVHWFSNYVKEKKKKPLEFYCSLVFYQNENTCTGLNYPVNCMKCIWKCSTLKRCSGLQIILPSICIAAGKSWVQIIQVKGGYYCHLLPCSVAACLLNPEWQILATLLPWSLDGCRPRKICETKTFSSRLFIFYIWRAPLAFLDRYKVGKVKWQMQSNAFSIFSRGCRFAEFKNK